jgi:hypothetical protein
LIASLRDGLTRERVEIDMIKFSGPAFTGIDQRLMTLQLVKQGLTDVALSTAEGEVVQPSEVLYKRPILVERGSFRPITRLTLDMLESAREQFLSEPRLAGEEPVVLMEMTLHNLETAGDHQDFLDRAELLHTVGSHVLISNCDRYFSLVEILSQYTDKMIGIALGVPAMRAVGDEQYYVDLAGGRLEAIGRMFKSPVKFYVYPTKESGSDKIVTAENITFPPPFEHLHAYLLEGGHVEGLRRYDESYLNIHTPEVLAAIQAGDPRWEAQVPPAIVQTIKERELFGYRSNA